MQPTKFELVINLKDGEGARPDGAVIMQMAADEVIE